MSFILIILPLFRFDGEIIDPDFYLFQNTSFTETIKNYFETTGPYRILSITLGYYIPQIFVEFSYKSYIVVFFYFVTNYILAEKILKLFGFCAIRRLIAFIILTSSFLIIPTVFTWSRTQNELISILIAWAFIWSLKQSKSETFSTFLFFLWLLASLLTYELHFPFLAALAIALGFVPRGRVFIFLVCLPLVLYFIPIGDHKFSIESNYVYSSLNNLFPYIAHKWNEAAFTLSEVSVSMTLVPLFCVLTFFTFVCFSFKKTELLSARNNIGVEVKIIVMSFTLIMLAYTISWPQSSPATFQTIALNGKLNWNIVYCFYFNVSLAAIFHAKNIYSFLLKLSPFFLIILYSGAVVRSVKADIQGNQLDEISTGLFKNVYMYIM